MKTKIHPADLVPANTRIVLEERTRKKLFRNKNHVMKRLKLHRNTVNAWIRGEYSPSIEQMKKLGFNIKYHWGKVKLMHLEGGRKKLLIPEKLPIEELSWLAGMLDGDGKIVPNHRIVVYNQDEILIEKSLTVCKKIGINQSDAKLELYNVEIMGFKPNKPVIRLTINSRILAEFMRNFRNILTKEIRNGNTFPFHFYVKGLADSDGGFVRNNICIQQKATAKGYEQLQMVKLILDSLGIQNGGIKGPDIKLMLRLYIYSSKSNLQKYHKFIGFVGKRKSEKLESLVS